VTEQAKITVFDYIEGWCNPRRRHSGVDYLSPLDFERRHYSQSITESPILSTEVG
jgi:putative transposase